MSRAILFWAVFSIFLGGAAEASACPEGPRTPPVEVQEARLINGAAVIAVGLTDSLPGTEVTAEIRPTEVLRGTSPGLIVVGDEFILTDCPASIVPNLPRQWNVGDEVLVVMTVQDGELRPYDVSLLSGSRGQRLLARARASMTAAQ